VISGDVEGTALVSPTEGKNLHEAVRGGQQGKESLKLPQTPFQPLAICGW